MLELVILIGLQGSGKTTFFRRSFEGTHVHVSKDRFPNAKSRERRQTREIDEALSAGRSVVVDNTNATRDARAGLIELGRRLGARVLGYYLESSLDACRRRNEAREGKARVPLVGLYAMAKRLERPSLEEGFDQLRFVRIADDGFDVLPWVVENGR